MDGYLYNLDPYRQSSAGYYTSRLAPSYPLERRSSYGLLASDPYAIVPIDPYAGYGAAPSYQPDGVLRRSRYASPPTHSSTFRPRPRTGPKRKPPPPAQNLGAKKKPFKQTQKVNFYEEKGRSSKKPLQKKPLQATTKAEKPAKSETALLKETKELHSLFRTGVDPNAGKKFAESGGKKGEGKKRKAETQTQKLTPAKEAVESGKKKRQKGKSNKKFANDKKSEKLEASTPALEKVERAKLTEEEKKEAESALELQRGLSERVREFLGAPPALEQLETKEEAAAAAPDANPEENKETQKPSKPEQSARTPEEENEADEKSFEYFSKIFEDNQELRNLYTDKCNSGSFECLVCYSTEAKTSKQFWNLVSLIMHTKMRKQKRPEHRGYGRAVSAVLGWDFHNTPKVPRSQKQTLAADKPTEEVKKEKEPETDEKEPETDGKIADIEEEVVDADATEKEQEEEAAEGPSKDSKEE